MRARAEFISVFTGAVGGLIVLAALAAADGIERKPPTPPIQVTEEGLEEAPNLLGGPEGSPPVQVVEAPVLAPAAAPTECPTYEEALTMVQSAAPNATDEEIDSSVETLFTNYEDCEEFQRAVVQARQLTRWVRLERPRALEDPVPPRRLVITRDTEPPGDGEPPGGGGGPGYTG